MINYRFEYLDFINWQLAFTDFILFLQMLRIKEWGNEQESVGPPDWDSLIDQFEVTVLRTELGKFVWLHLYVRKEMWIGNDDGYWCHFVCHRTYRKFQTIVHYTESYQVNSVCYLFLTKKLSLLLLMKRIHQWGVY